MAGSGPNPRGGWYLESGAGMGQTLVLAAEKGAYTLSDLATHLTVGRKRGLVALYAGEDPLLLNPYTYYLVPGGPRPRRRRPCAASWPRRRPPAWWRA